MISDKNSIERYIKGVLEKGALHLDVRTIITPTNYRRLPPFKRSERSERRSLTYVRCVPDIKTISVELVVLVPCSLLSKLNLYCHLCLHWCQSMRFQTRRCVQKIRQERIATMSTPNARRGNALDANAASAIRIWSKKTSTFLIVTINSMLDACKLGFDVIQRVPFAATLLQWKKYLILMVKSTL